MLEFEGRDTVMSPVQDFSTLTVCSIETNHSNRYAVHILFFAMYQEYVSSLFQRLCLPVLEHAFISLTKLFPSSFLVPSTPPQQSDNGSQSAHSPH